MPSPTQLLLIWYDQNKRDLPWRRDKDPYHIWLSEIMLQQTRVEAVKGYYARFLALFPDVQALADTSTEDVLKAWEGLGYYSRARNLHKAAKEVTDKWQGHFPDTYDGLLSLPGVGPYTAGAIASIAFDRAVPAIDGNVYRVMSRFRGVREDIAAPSVQKTIRQEVMQLLNTHRPGDLNQALMELGATVCTPTSPKCDSCPWQSLCDAFSEGDMEQLPVHEKKKPPKIIPMAVGMVTYNRKVLVSKRNQKMLQGMYVFTLLEDETRPEVCQDLLNEMGLRCSFVKKLGEGRHVFTHRVWEMEYLHFELSELPEETVLSSMNAFLADASQLAALPIPSAMKEACNHAMKLIREKM